MNTLQQNNDYDNLIKEIEHICQEIDKYNNSDYSDSYYESMLEKKRAILIKQAYKSLGYDNIIHVDFNVDKD